MARVAGVDFYIHWSFSLIILWVIFQGSLDGSNIQAISYTSVALLLLFGSVALHELGHVLIALRLNVLVRSVTLLPIGGLAHIQAVPQRPLHEMLIAAAGPLVNLGLAICFAAALFVTDSRPLLGLFLSPRLTAEAIFLHASFWQNPGQGLLMFLFLSNLILFVFNLIPTFPMDGGRILRATLAMFLPYIRATQIAIGLGQLTAVLMFCGALRMRNYTLIFIALLVLLAGLPVLMGQPSPSKMTIETDD